LSGDINGNVDTSYFTLNLDADHLYTFPLQFGDNSEDDVEGVNTVNIQGNSLVTFRMGTTTTEVDGYGTLHTPAGTFENVLRVKRTEDLADDLSGIATTQEVVRYDWVSPNYRYLLFHTEEIIIRDFLGNEQSRSTVTYYSTPAVINSAGEVGISIQNFRLYPNPTPSYLQLELPAESFGQMASICIYNAQGQCIYQQLQTSLNKQLNVSQLTAGYYWIEIRQGVNRYQASFTKS
ncbi:MAG: T9SS type A sorting domain-containing protein, partial [Bacteroidota bacterium]